MVDSSDSSNTPVHERILHFETRTPIWTGGASGKMDRLHETGLLGSLRWWFELFVRGMGGDVSDPVSDNQDKRSALDPEKYEKLKHLESQRERLLKSGVCDVSQVFGATGWRRRFRLVVQSSALLEYKSGFREGRNNVSIKSDRTGRRGNATWYLPAYPQAGQFAFRLQSLAPDFDVNVVAGLLQFLVDYAAIGAKNQVGLGVVKFKDDERVATDAFHEWLLNHQGNHPYSSVPRLDDLFLARIETRNLDPKQTFNLKYDLRSLRLFSGERNKYLRHTIMGTTSGQRRAAKVSVSLPYVEDDQFFIRVWGWIPPKDRSYGSRTRNEIVEAIHTELEEVNTGRILVWREFDSPRDTVKANLKDKQAFLRSLLHLEELAYD
jgi:CRISPR-associated protein Cmr1